MFEVSIHTPIQGVTSNSVPISRCIKSFNPHTHTGCDLNNDDAYYSTKVSIHTPIQGVTLVTSRITVWAWVSIHTPIQGVTSIREEFIPDFKFQSTHPYRVWLRLPLCVLFGKSVSIHTPIQGVTYLPCVPFFLHACFNPHTHTGCDVMAKKTIKEQYVSIHTPIQGVTCDGASSGLVLYVSIHTPIQGVTFITKPVSFLFQVSIHTPIQGVT